MSGVLVVFQNRHNVKLSSRRYIVFSSWLTPQYIVCFNPRMYETGNSWKVDRNTMLSITQCRKVFNKHFNNIACTYNDCRSLDEAPVKYLTDFVGTDAHTICSLGCGTGRYLIALMKAFKSAGIHMNAAYGVDTSSIMLEIARMD